MFLVLQAQGVVYFLFTFTTTSSLDERALSDAVSRRRKLPVLANRAVVLSALALAKVTVPGPLTFLQVVVRAPGGFGSPSSEAVPASGAPFGRVIV